MKALAYISIIVAVVSIIIGIVLAATGKQFPPKIGLLAETYMDFTKVCLLFAVAFSLVELAKAKK